MLVSFLQTCFRLQFDKTYCFCQSATMHSFLSKVTSGWFLKITESNSTVCRVPLYMLWWKLQHVNTSRPRQHGRHFADDTFKRIFLNENFWISIKIWLKFVPKGPINNIPALVQIMAWRRPGDKPLSEPVMVILSTHICVSRPQWVKQILWW